MPESTDTPQQLAKPKASWSPLAKAVFRLGIADDSEKATSSSLGGLNDATALSLPQLRATLKEKSGACRVEIGAAHGRPNDG